jgi:hypothetical protein
MRAKSRRIARAAPAPIDPAQVVPGAPSRLVSSRSCPSARTAPQTGSLRHTAENVAQIGQNLLVPVPSSRVLIVQAYSSRVKTVHDCRKGCLTVIEKLSAPRVSRFPASKGIFPWVSLLFSSRSITSKQIECTQVRNARASPKSRCRSHRPLREQQDAPSAFRGRSSTRKPRVSPIQTDRDSLGKTVLSVSLRSIGRLDRSAVLPDGWWQGFYSTAKDLLRRVQILPA